MQRDTIRSDAMLQNFSENNLLKSVFESPLGDSFGSPSSVSFEVHSETHSRMHFASPRRPQNAASEQGEHPPGPSVREVGFTRYVSRMPPSGARPRPRPSTLSCHTGCRAPKRTEKDILRMASRQLQLRRRKRPCSFRKNHPFYSSA